MIDERAYELALSQLAQAREEKMLLFEQVKRLTEEVALLRSSSSSQADQQAETIKELTATYMATRFLMRCRRQSLGITAHHK